MYMRGYQWIWEPSCFSARAGTKRDWRGRYRQHLWRQSFSYIVHKFRKRGGIWVGDILSQQVNQQPRRDRGGLAVGCGLRALLHGTQKVLAELLGSDAVGLQLLKKLLDGRAVHVSIARFLGRAGTCIAPRGGIEPGLENLADRALNGLVSADVPGGLRLRLQCGKYRLLDLLK